MTYLIIAAIVAVILYFLLSKKENDKVITKGGSTAEPEAKKPVKQATDRNMYDELKQKAYNWQYNDFDLPAAEGAEVLYGVLMDWDYDGETIVTLVSFKTGEASIYLSSGAMIIGAGQHEDARAASIAFINSAEALLPNAHKYDGGLTIVYGYLKFYLLTNKGKYVVKD